MSSLVEVHYEPIEAVTPQASKEFLNKMLNSQLPGFIVKKAGTTLYNALKTTGLGKYMSERGYTGDLKETVTFAYDTSQILPADLSTLVLPDGGDWYLLGVTPFHQDIGSPRTKISLNHTSAGKALFRLHPGRDAYDPIAQWDELNPQVENVLLHGMVDPDVLDPRGYSGVAEAGDLLVFDTSYIHAGQSLQVPRSSEAVFYMRDE